MPMPTPVPTPTPADHPPAPRVHSSGSVVSTLRALLAGSIVIAACGGKIAETPPSDTHPAAALDADAGAAGPDGVADPAEAGGADGSTGCIWTVSGASIATGGCSFTASYDATADQLDLVLSGTTAAPHFGALGFYGVVDGQATLNAGTIATSDAPRSTASYDVRATPNLRWRLCAKDSCAQGILTLTITDPGVRTGKSWRHAHGTLALELLADPATPADGLAEIHVTF